MIKMLYVVERLPFPLKENVLKTLNYDWQTFSSSYVNRQASKSDYGVENESM